MNGFIATARLLGRYAHANVQAALEYRTSLISQALGMLLTDVMWVVFWGAYFSRFKLPDWGPKDILLLWSIICTSYGIANTLCGNALKLGGMIARGEMDFYLALPKPVLPHVLVSRMHLVGPGDFFFGVGAFLFTAPHSAAQWGSFVLSALTGAVILVSFNVLTGSLAFWLGNSEGLSGQLYGAITNFSTYPTSIFKGVTKVVLYTVIPAGFIAGLPVELVRSPSWLQAGVLAGAAAFFAAFSTAVFHAGLRRYASGNLVLMRD
jgi:ABC-2 type transport system permease protein